jgi:anti-sigma B factor antagonist
MSEPSELTIDVDAFSEAVTVRCAGALTLTSAPQLRSEVKRLLPAARVVTIDLTNVTLLDSFGLGTIAALYASTRAAGSELRLVNLSPRIRELFSVTRILSLFEPCGDANVRMV